MEISQLKELLEAFDKSSAAVLEVHEGNLSIYLEKDAKTASDSLPPIPGGNTEDLANEESLTVEESTALID